MDNNDKQKSEGQSSGSTNRDNNFDRKIKDLLQDAVLQPPPDFFTSIEAALEKETMAQPAENANDKRPFTLKIWRRKWSYAASIGILILLSLGFWKLDIMTGKEEKPVSALLNPNTLLSESVEDSQKQPVHRNDINDDLDTVIKQAASKENGNEGEIASKSNDAKTNNRDQASETGKKEADAATSVKPKAEIRLAAVEKDIRNDAATLEQEQAQAQPNAKAVLLQGDQPIVAHPAKSVETKIPTREIAQNVEPQTKPEVGSPVEDKAAHVARIPAPRSELAVSSVPKSHQEDSPHEDSRRKGKRGLFQGLVNHFKERVDEISNEVVAEDDQKTRIQVGCIAVTTYK